MMGAVMVRASSRALDYKLWLYDSSIPPVSLTGRPNWFGPLRPVDIQHAFGFAQLSRKRGSEVVAVGGGPDAAEVVEMFAEEARKRESETRVKTMGEAFRQALQDNAREHLKSLGLPERPKTLNEAVEENLRAWGLLEAHDEWKARMEEARAQREAEWT